MEVAHAPLIERARVALTGKAGTVLDLGAGNGRLVAAICAGTALRPAGVELDPAKTARARARMPEAAADLVTADLFDTTRWPAPGRYAAVILMAGRLFEVQRQRALALVGHLRSCADSLLLYTYARLEWGELPELLEALSLPGESVTLRAPVSIAVLRSPI
jgi:hypothetical protein